MRTTQRKGDIAVTRAIYLFTELGYDVSIPVTESAEYDLIVDNTDGLFRVQCKSCSTPNVDLRKIHSNSSGYVIKNYSQNSYDWLFVYNPVLKKDYLSKEFVNQNYIALSKLGTVS